MAVAMVTARARVPAKWRASVGPRPAGARVGGAICCEAAPPESI